MSQERPNAARRGTSPSPSADVTPSWDGRATLVWVVVVLLLSNIPYFQGLALRKEGELFMGLFNGDVASYLAKMRDGFDGLWRHENHFTTEPTKPSLLFMFYVFWGHVARWFGLSLLAGYQVARITGAVFMMLTVRRLIRVLGLRDWAAFTAFALSFSLTALPIRLPDGLYVRGYYIAEAHGLYTVMNYAHMSYSTGFLVLIMTEFLRLLEDIPRKRSWLIITVSAFLMTWIHPRLLLTGGAVGWVLASLVVMLHKRIPWSLAVGGLLFLAAGAIPALMITRSYRGDPILEFWASVETWSPNPVVMLFAYGLLIPMGLAGGIMGRRRGWSGALFLLIWMVVGFGLCYYPAGFQRRMFQGLDIPFALGSGYFIGCLIPWGCSRFDWIRRFPFVVPLAILLFCNIRFLPTLRELATPIRDHNFPFFIPEPYWRSLDWLRHHTRRDDVVLSSSTSGQTIPALAGNRVFMGHWAETFQREAKKKEFEVFRNPATPPDWREAFLDRHGIRYFFVSGFELKPAEETPDLTPYNPLDDTSTWRVAHAEPSLEKAVVVILERIPRPVSSPSRGSAGSVEGTSP